jgi:hypothetical protein
MVATSANGHLQTLYAIGQMSWPSDCSVVAHGLRKYYPRRGRCLKCHRSWPCSRSFLLPVCTSNARACPAPNGIKLDAALVCQRTASGSAHVGTNDPARQDALTRVPKWLEETQ